MGEALWVGSLASPPAGEPAFVLPGAGWSLDHGSSLWRGPGLELPSPPPLEVTPVDAAALSLSREPVSREPIALEPIALDGAPVALAVAPVSVDLVADLDLMAGSPDAVTDPAAGDPANPLAPMGRLAVAALRGARQVAGDPRVSGLLRAGPSVAAFIARSRERSAVAALDDTVVPVRATPGLALQAYLDELVIALFRHPELLPKEGDYAPAASDLEELHALFSWRGWLDQPDRYHRDPDPPGEVEVRHEHRQGLGFEHVSFTSGWEPEPGEPGRGRWLDHDANQTVHAWVSRVPGRHRRSWLVCAHGLGMGGNGAVDLRAFRAPQLARRGINVVAPVLPLHGPRASGRVRGEDLMTIDMVDSLHGVAQATWDLRRVIRWLRHHEGAEQIGVMGYSLGGLVAALVASLEDDLACVVAGIPVVDLPHLFRRHSPPHVARLARSYGVLGPSADDVHRVVSPLAMRCRVPFDRRFIFAGLADRMSTFGHARRLWLHWGQPAWATYAGGHVGFYWSGAVKRFVDDALSRSFARSPGIAA